MTQRDVVAEFGTDVLARHNFFERETSRPREVGIVLAGNRWEVYRTDERGAEDGRIEFLTESEALEFFARALRGLVYSRRGAAW